MIEGTQLMPSDPQQPEMVSILQSRYTKLANQLAKLDFSNGEVLTFVMKHLALCSSSEIRINNFRVLIYHLEDCGYPALIEKFKALLPHMEVLLKNLAATQLLVPNRKSTNELVKNQKLNYHAKFYHPPITPTAVRVLIAIATP
ncbi:hypothetical protein GCK72_012773 [Caenorhabditis remanei]|uniref:Uncharacterized protein n=1 Tax=Caenorhabditis remanei TaxID=31234 RepID=A0A6A5GLW4_CAERE|nr:hypothetical protein GCK72_012773 [Caenorhabditis remanei]KAF1756320.1 hypothetical protein GCK72_012773 [Caenorhabditis remanei]